MSNDSSWEKVKKGWNWIWNSDSVWSWLVALLVIFVFVKFIFFPILSIILGTSLPLAGVESSSMDHQITESGLGSLSICGSYGGAKDYLDFEGYWDICGEWYEDHEINKNKFRSFPLRNGFNKGDIVVVYGRFSPELGDVIIFKPNLESLAPRPIVHRIVNLEEVNNELVMGTKGDHNADQLTKSNNALRTDETNIKEDQIIGKVVFRIPYLGWLKIWVTELINWVF
jgi:signal peptidase I